MTLLKARSRCRGPSAFAWSLRSVSAGALAVLAACASVEAPDGAGVPSVHRVYFLGGQSNMEGFGFTAEFSEQEREPAERVTIYSGRMVEDGQDGGGVGVWEPLEPGYGTGFSTDGKFNALLDRIGPELALGRRMSEGEPDANFAIIKCARGGSALVSVLSGYG